MKTGIKLSITGLFAVLVATTNTSCKKESEDCTVKEWYQDADGDGFGDPSIAVSSCDKPAGYALANNDCDDADRFVNPGMIEISGDGIDNNCDGNSLISIGDNYQGGIVFYLDQSGEHGLVASPIDQGSSTPWCSDTNSYCDVSSTRKEIGYGKQNTKYIISTFGTGNYAAKLCDESEINSYQDWFLPSKDELELMHTNLYLNGLGEFSEVSYWSSTNKGWGNAFVKRFYKNNLYNYAEVNTLLHVRAIREF